MTSLQHKLALINIGVILFGIAIFGYWYFLDGNINPVLVDKTDTSTLRVNKAVYSPGETVIIYNSFCKLRPVIGTSAFQIVDGQVLQMNAIEVNLPVGCYGVDKPFSSNATTLPENIEKGTWHLEWTITYHTDPVKDVVYKRRSVDFTVI